MLTAKAIAACRAHGIDTLVIGGGVAANSRLRSLARASAARSTASRVRVPRPRLCTDNGAMVAALGVAPGRGRTCPRAASTCRPTRRCRSLTVSRSAGGEPLIVRMWEVRAQQRNLTELLSWVCDVALPAIEVDPLHCRARCSPRPTTGSW